MASSVARCTSRRWRAWMRTREVCLRNETGAMIYTQERNLGRGAGGNLQQRNDEGGARQRGWLRRRRGTDRTGRQAAAGEQQYIEPLHVTGFKCFVVGRVVGDDELCP